MIIIWNLASPVVQWARQTGIAGNKLVCAGGTTTQHFTSCTVTYPAMEQDTHKNNSLTSPGQDCFPDVHVWLYASWCFCPSVPQLSPEGKHEWSAFALSQHCPLPQWSILGNHPEVSENKMGNTFKSRGKNTKFNILIIDICTLHKCNLRWFSESSWTSTWPCLPWASLQCFQGSLKSWFKDKVEPDFERKDSELQHWRVIQQRNSAAKKLTYHD